MPLNGSTTVTRRGATLFGWTAMFLKFDIPDSAWASTSATTPDMSHLSRLSQTHNEKFFCTPPLVSSFAAHRDLCRPAFHVRLCFRLPQTNGGQATTH